MSNDEAKGSTMTQQKQLSATDIATELGVDPKTLRRFLRENGSYNNPGSGGRYKFTVNEAKSVKTAFNKWNQTRSARQTGAGKVSSKGKTVTSAKQRVDALETSLRKTGKHISQHAE